MDGLRMQLRGNRDSEFIGFIHVQARHCHCCSSNFSTTVDSRRLNFSARVRGFVPSSLAKDIMQITNLQVISCLIQPFRRYPLLQHADAPNICDPKHFISEVLHSSYSSLLHICSSFQSSCLPLGPSSLEEFRRKERKKEKEMQ